MSKLLQRLQDPARSGVYRARGPEAILEAARGSGLDVVTIDVADDGVFRSTARALQFPDWFGANWDALEDCLTDLSWSSAGGHILLIEGVADLPGDERGIFADILGSAAAYWAERGRPFFAVFVGGEPPLPELYREKK